MSKKTATAAEKAYMNRVAEINCVACGKSPVEIHHPRFAGCMGKRSPHWLATALCPACHRGALSIHGSKKQFEAIYGSEVDLLAETIKRVFSDV